MKLQFFMTLIRRTPHFNPCKAFWNCNLPFLIIREVSLDYVIKSSFLWFLFKKCYQIKLASISSVYHILVLDNFFLKSKHIGYNSISVCNFLDHAFQNQITALQKKQLAFVFEYVQVSNKYLDVQWHLTQFVVLKSVFLTSTPAIMILISVSIANVNTLLI